MLRLRMSRSNTTPMRKPDLIQCFLYNWSRTIRCAHRSNRCGKTTIMQLLTGLYEKTDGAILFDGVPIEPISKASLREQMAFVLQDPFLFEMSIKENIRYGRLDATDEEMIEAAKKANAHAFIEKLPDQYDTVLSSDGSQISQGQKQLLSIARAFVANPKILLLDEATSSIDTITELHIQAALEKLMENRTSFIIAHRLNTIRKVDYRHRIKSRQNS